MFDFTLKNEIISMAAGGVQSTAHYAYQAALHKYRQALKKGRGRKLWARLVGRDRKLKDLNAIIAERKVLSSSYAGMCTVLIDNIHGSEGRTADFDADFLPLKTHNRDRWTGVAQARMQGHYLPAVELIQVENDYYVRDGHHRISVARQFGQEAIDADVTVLHLAGLKNDAPATAPRCEKVWKTAGVEL